MATNVIVMISDGIGYNGWLAADYYWRGKTRAESYQYPRPGDHPWAHLGMAHWALSFVDHRRLPVSYDGSALPVGAVDHIHQDYDPNTRWERFENALRFDFEPYGVPYASYTDSAASATALFSGNITTVARLNMNWNASQRYVTIADLAHRRGLATGVVSTVPASHATPAGVVVQNRYRNHLDEIFPALLASPLDAIIGAGHPYFDDNGRERSEPDFLHVGNESVWRTLLAADGRNGFSVIDDRERFEALADGGLLPPDRVVGIPRAGNTLQARRDAQAADSANPSGMAFNPNVPDLATLSLGALRVLSRNNRGFFIMIEGGAVDWMNHDNDMPRMLEEQRDFNRAVAAVIAWVEANSNWAETLLIVTADHETGGIWGEGVYDADNPRMNFHPRVTKFNGFIPVQNRGKGRLPGYQYATVNHTNDLVPLWAIGKGAERFLDNTRVDAQAARLWGEAYGWDGRFVHNTDVFRVSSAVLLG